MCGGMSKEKNKKTPTISKHTHKKGKKENNQIEIPKENTKTQNKTHKETKGLGREGRKEGRKGGGRKEGRKEEREGGVKMAYDTAAIFTGSDSCGHVPTAKATRKRIKRHPATAEEDMPRWTHLHPVVI